MREVLTQPFRSDAARRRIIADTDVFVISYPKSGRTWLTLMVTKALCLHYDYADGVLVNGNTLVKQLKEERDADLRVLGFGHDRSGPESGLRHYRKMVNAKDEFAGKDVAFLVRDPKDVVVSFYFEATKRARFFQGSLSEFVRDPRVGVRKIIAFNKAWYENRHIPRRFELLRYEEIRSDPRPAVRTILDMIGATAVSAETLDAAVDFASFDNMKELERTDALNAATLRAGDVADPESFKVRKGKIGGYRDYLGAEDIEYIDDCLRRMEYPL